MHFLGANRTLPTGFAIFSSTVLKLRDLDVCFIATSTIYDCPSIQIGTFSHFIHIKIHVHFFRYVQTRHFLHSVVPPGGKIYQAGFAIFSSTVDILLDLKVCFIATSKLYDWRRIQIYMFVDI